ncbi:MAG TPA: hypothetical protein PKD64_06825 [Pirellulaceae bacterium]|nr:hypothetical protein [Pirellulaceae bacterium]HMO91896.1 hypothetical protein [Pirellulaceae bacterium]HMP68696.1 hypothetical protein [Pirellulaceae bacterium]
MKRFFKVTGKKRGTRLTGSPRLRGLGEVIASSVLALFGLVSLLVVLAFQFNALRLGEPVNWTVFALQSSLAAALFVLGLWGMLRVIWSASTSLERREAIATRAREINPLHEVNPLDEHWPTVPVRLFWRLRPGEILRFQLWPKQQPRWNLIVSGSLALVFLIVTTILSAMNFDSIRLGTIDVLGVALNLALLVACVWTIQLFFRQLLTISGFGPTRLELNGFPLQSGETYEFVLVQTGRIRVKVIEILLICVEEATFRDGTDLRTERREVARTRVFRRRGIELKPKEPLCERGEIQIPQGAMHSFESQNNLIRWHLKVVCQARGWPDHCRVFPVLVAPTRHEPHGVNREG